MVRVEKTPERTSEREGVESISNYVVLNLGDKIADGALLRRTFPDEFKRSPQGLALCGNQSNALKFEPVFEETLELHPVGLVIDACERLQRHFVLAQVEVLSAERLGQNKRRVTLVEEEDLTVWNRAEVCRDRSKRDALAAPGRTVDAGMTGIADV
jgi:hypothetical protein